MTDFIKFCAEHNCGGAELTSYFFEPEVGADYLAECRHLAHTTGIEISGTAVGNNFSYPKGAPEREEQMAYVRQWIDNSAILGAPHIRVFAGKHPKGVSEEDAERNASEALEEAGEYAGKQGIFLGIENHDSIGTADRLLRIVKAVKSPWVGVNLDTGNFRADDPYAEMIGSAPYAVNVQVKVSLKIGAKEEPADLERIAKILQDAGYQGYVVLEYEENDDPFEHVPPVLDRMRKFCDL
jgi:sugar phosphate isomerase/epimerase